MELTRHGTERILGRTKMLARDVLSMIQGNAVVRLGSADGCEYLLFYSPPDHRTKIALVSDERTRLVSIWEDTYILPESLLKVTSEHRYEARKALKAFLAKRITLKPKVPKPKNLRPVIAKVEVCVGTETVYIHDCGEIAMEDGKEGSSSVKALKPQLESILEVVEANRKSADTDVLYRINIYYSPTSARVFRTHNLRHKTLRKRLRAA